MASACCLYIASVRFQATIVDNGAQRARAGGSAALDNGRGATVADPIIARPVGVTDVSVIPPPGVRARRGRGHGRRGGAEDGQA